MAEELPLEPAIDRPGLKRSVSLGVPNREEAPFKFFPWDVQAATAIAVVAIFLVAIFNLSPLLLIVIFFALCAYIAAQSVLDKHK